MVNRKQIEDAFREIFTKYPDDQQRECQIDLSRLVYHVELVIAAKGPKARICDIGGGIGPFSIGCAAVGMKSVLVDDFRDPTNEQHGDSILDIHRSYGVEVISRDVVDHNIDFPPESFDVISSFHSMEHWHHSPKKLFAKCVECLAPGGMFLLAVPNCNNLRKRITTPLGLSSWSQMHDWYETERFRGHVREPKTADLRYIARDMGLVNTHIFGRNWLGLHGSPTTRLATQIVDLPLRLFPSLCSDIYLSGYKPK